MKVMLVASTGGHLRQLLDMESWWGEHDRVWVTFPEAYAKDTLGQERAIWAFYPTSRNIPNALRNMKLAVKVLRAERPDIIVSTGAGVAVPFFVVARFLKIRTAFIEVFDRIDLPTLTGRMVYPLSDVFAVQWPQQLANFPAGTNIGRLM
jgi:beta-1,4-N-acetylglucosaminyltransferase